jgi:excisionase family DNA binding protein
MATELTLTVPEAARLLGLSQSAAYDAVKCGEIPAVRIGRRVLVKRRELLALFPSSEPIEL